ncbi:starch synthase [Sphaerotilus hippei]|uniref:Glycogen synthase n=1 Tax=Sphaerotilus hippei TaxID=744406 RepID=A0A318H3N1_9BURK|nr:glycogen synthase GlgA [Sphaerotilus hippei]PXW98034.1 starch synthase [Sphaerotilus hippei]
MRVLQVCAEIFPLLKTGGLADVAGALPRAMKALGVDMRVLLPGFDAFLAGLEEAVPVAEFVTPFSTEPVRLLYGWMPACDTNAYLIEAPGLYQRPGGPYADASQHPYADNHLRFALLGWMAARLAEGLDSYWRPDVVHAHDWHAALAPAYVREVSDRQRYRVAATVYTVHNLAYQGMFGAALFDTLALPPSYWGVRGIEFHGQISFMKGGLYFADRLTTVSPTYAREIQGPEQGCGLDGLLRDRAHELSGVLNGVDDLVWNPATDRLLPHTYNTRRLIGKARCKATLQAELGLQEDPLATLLCIVSRLTEQKGLHLVLQAVPGLIERGAQVALLGSGDAGMEAAFRALAAAHPDRVSVRIGYDEQFAHRLIAGSDVIMVPSRYEPCGLTQLYGLKYGTLPLVRRVGGLADTVNDTRLETLDTDATGFVFDDFHVGALLHGADRAIALHRRKADWQLVQKRAMTQPCDWSVAAHRYLEVYQQALG